jgi:hypothetical protein
LFGGGADVPGETEVGQLGEGDVDREGEVIGDVLGGGEDGGEEFAGEETVKTGLFGEGDEVVWGDEAALRMLPAGEGFEAAKKAGAKLYERLKIRNDLVIFECSAQIIRVISSHGRDDTTATNDLHSKFSRFPAGDEVAAAGANRKKVNDGEGHPLLCKSKCVAGCI